MVVEPGQHGVEGGSLVGLELPRLLHDGVDLRRAALRGLHAVAPLHVHHHVRQRLHKHTQSKASHTATTSVSGCTNIHRARRQSHTATTSVSGCTNIHRARRQSHTATTSVSGCTNIHRARRQSHTATSVSNTHRARRHTQPPRPSGAAQTR